MQLNTKPAESVFVGPDGFEKLAAPPATPPPPAVSKIAEDVYLLQGLAGGTHNTLFVAFNDHVLVLEAPEQIIYGQQFGPGAGEDQRDGAGQADQVFGADASSLGSRGWFS